MGNTAEVIDFNRQKIMQEKRGFIIQYRAIDDQEWSSDPACMLVSQFLIRNVVFKHHNITYRGNALQLAPGQFVTTMSELARKSAVLGMFQSSKNPEQSAKSCIQRTLKILKSDGFLSYDLVGSGCLKSIKITVKNWTNLQYFSNTVENTVENTVQNTQETQAQQVIEGKSNTVENTVQNTVENTLNKQCNIINKSTNVDGAKPQSQKSPAFNYKKLVEDYREVLSEMPNVVFPLSADRQNKIRILSKKYNLANEQWRNYFEYVATNCQWMLVDRVDGSTDKKWRKKNLDYLVKESTYLSVKEGRANDL